jgi:hypothetical protein
LGTLSRLRLLAALAVTISTPLSRVSAQELSCSFASLRYIPGKDSAASRIIPAQLKDSSAERTYWLEGALIGGVPVALLGTALARWESPLALL